MIWPRVPRMWPGSTVFIIGGGPSASPAVTDFSPLYEGQRVIACNNAYGDPVYSGKNLVAMIPRKWVDICWFGDQKWWGWHHDLIRPFPNLIATCATNTGLRDKVKRVKAVNRGKKCGIMKNPARVSWNACSGTSAINLAYHLGAARVVLLGFDMGYVDGRKNYHTDHQEPDADPFDIYLKYLKVVAKEAKELGLEIVNATPDSACKSFPFATIAEVI